MKRPVGLSVWSPLSALVLPGFLAVLLTALLTGCATTGPAENVADEASAPPPRDDIAEMIVGAQGTPAPALPAFSKADFIDRPPADLEGLLGRPALVRREGAGEFRRYDTQNCRLYAVVFPDEGGRPVVKSLSVGPLVVGAPTPEFASCFVTGS